MMVRAFLMTFRLPPSAFRFRRATMPEPVFFQHFQVDQKPDGGLLELGRGAMGITYKAFDTNLQCPVALKIINATLTDDERARERFLREARAAARLRHPNVATVLHLGKDDQSFFYAMEFIEGETLEAFVAERGPLPPILALEIVQQVARALGAAQNEGLVHRDIKPANLMLVHHRGEADDEGVHVKVIDFGLAKFVEKGKSNPDSVNLTMAGGFVGSPYFASPEQVDEGEIDTRSDIYSLGATLWFLLAGEPPFTGSLGQVFAQHLQRPPPYERLAAHNVPKPVLALLRRLLAKAPEDRPSDPAVLRREVTACLRALGALTGSSSGISSAAGLAATQVAGNGRAVDIQAETRHSAGDEDTPPPLLPDLPPDLPPELPPPQPLPSPPSPPPLPPFVPPFVPPVPPARPAQTFTPPPTKKSGGGGKSCLIAGSLVTLVFVLVVIAIVAVIGFVARHANDLKRASHHAIGYPPDDSGTPNPSQPPETPAATPENDPHATAPEVVPATPSEVPPVVPYTPPPYTPPPSPSVYSPAPVDPPRRVLPVLPGGIRALASYRARLSERDHRSSAGVRLTQIPEILRQDRANFYRSNDRDPEDEADPLFASATQRARIEKNNLRYFGRSDLIINGTPYVQVDVYPGGIAVTVLSP